MLPRLVNENCQPGEFIDTLSNDVERKAFVPGRTTVIFAYNGLSLGPLSQTF